MFPGAIDQLQQVKRQSHRTRQTKQRLKQTTWCLEQTLCLCGFSFFDASPARTPPGARYRSRILTVLKAGHFSTLENHRNIFPSPLDKGRVLLRPPKPLRHVGGEPPVSRRVGAGFFPAPCKFDERNETSPLSVKFAELLANFCAV